MNEEFFRQRLSQLRSQKGVSARDMSLTLGQSESYINKIENGKAFPSMQIFFYICDYFGISPRDFFDEDAGNPVLLNTLIGDLKTLSDSQIANIANIVKDLKR
ncbi:MAG: helix-turn-helix domain-containing protein [Acetatifactor sp.]|nr:helix-turn-helix domain-containing protein [Acetatifactor sp.]